MTLTLKENQEKEVRKEMDVETRAPSHFIFMISCHYVN